MAGTNNSVCADVLVACLPISLMDGLKLAEVATIVAPPAAAFDHLAAIEFSSR